MIQISNLHKAYADQVLFDNVSLQMSAGERLGLVGRNGHGKSTLFRLILKQEESDQGAIVFPKNYRVGHLEQHLKFTKPTLLEEGCLGLLPQEKDQHYKVEAILFGLGFGKEDLKRKPEEFSGGYQIRLNLAKVLVSKPNLLLLDEPTNYLDILSMRWLVNFLKSWKNEMMIISHDRDFMDSVSTHTAAIHRQSIKKIQGSTEKLYNQILEEEEIHEKTRKNLQKKKEQTEVFINRFRAKASKAKSVQSKIKLMNKLPELKELSEIESLDFKFRHTPMPAKTVMTIEDLSFGFEPSSLLFSDFSMSIDKQDRIAIIGKNGKGKSTLLKLLAGELDPLQGQIKTHPQMSLGFFGQTNVNRLNPKAKVLDEVFESNPKLTNTEVRNICGTMMFPGDLAKKEVSVLSGGEKSRVLLGKILAHPSNILLLDEPTNHLDMQSIQSLVESLENFDGAVVLVTHSEMILRELGITKLVIFQKNNVEIFPGDYDDFLNKVGWEEEKKPNKKPKAPKKEFKGKKEFVKEKRKIKKEMQALENKILTLEESFAEQNQKLESITPDWDSHDIIKLSEAVVETQKQIETAFEELSELENQMKELEGQS